MDNGPFGLGVMEVGTFDDLGAEVVATFVGGIEVDIDVFALTDKVVHQRASVTSQPRSVTHNPLRIKTND